MERINKVGYHGVALVRNSVYAAYVCNCMDESGISEGLSCVTWEFVPQW